MVAKVDGNTVRTQRTRARVLAESLRLFNEHGEGHVTTGMIAGSLNISPGNLYYHFRNKEQIVEQLFARFEERVDLRPGGAGRGPEALEDLWLYLHLVLEGIWEYRFLYRNLDDLLNRNPRLRARFNRILDRMSEALVALCDGLVEAGAMRAGAEEALTLSHNALVVATYWLNFQSVRRADGARDGDVGRGAYQVMSLFGPYLEGEARRHLERIGRTYLD